MMKISETMISMETIPSKSNQGNVMFGNENSLFPIKYKLEGEPK